MKACLVVAHPDDETIFAGGLMLSHPDWEWTVICATFSDQDNPRGVQFWTAINLYLDSGIKVKAKMLGLEDKKGFFHSIDSDPDYKLRYEVWKKTIISHIDKHDILFTHNNMGEYGHSRHKIISKIVTESTNNVWNFLVPISGIIPEEYSELEIMKVMLRPEIQKRKREIFDISYASEQHIWKDLEDTMNFEFNAGYELFTRKQY